ncbi:MAG: hypothetical protein MUO77_02095 [Anaerolineales bacterium]|nr:hypothetical protein [Anaerolineales bacterium]
MTIIEVVILGFVLLELSNVLALYFAPGTKNANAVGVFTAWEKSKQYPEIHDFVKYLVYWVAGTKLIFILLLTVIIIFADAETQRISALALMIAILSFYWRLFPLIRKMDRNGQVEPKNYSVVLGVMIFVFVAVFLIAAIVGFFQ